MVRNQAEMKAVWKEESDSLFLGLIMGVETVV